MADVSFDDLVPAKKPVASGADVSFDDLVPAAKPSIGERVRQAFGATGDVPYGEGAGYLIDNPVTRALGLSAHEANIGLGSIVKRVVAEPVDALAGMAGLHPDLAGALQRSQIDPSLTALPDFQAPKDSKYSLALSAPAHLLGAVANALATGGGGELTTTKAAADAVPTTAAAIMDALRSSGLRTAGTLGTETAGTQAATSEAQGHRISDADLVESALAHTTANLLPMGHGLPLVARPVAGAASGAAGQYLSDQATGQEADPAAYLTSALTAAGLSLLPGGGKPAPLDLRTAADTATPATPASEAPAPPPEPVQPAPPPQAAATLLAALSGLPGRPPTDVAPLRDAAVTVAPPQPRVDARPATPEPARVVLPDGHPAPEPAIEPAAGGRNSDKSGDGLSTRVVATTTGKNGKPGAVRELEFRPEHDDLRTWIAANGGISPEAARELGIDPKAGKPLRPATRNAKLIADDGMDLDTVREKMHQDGWLPDEDPSRPSESDPRNLIFDAIHRGEVIDHPLSTRAEREAASRGSEAQAQDEALARQQRTTVPDLYERGAQADARLESPEYRDIQRPEGAAPIDGRIRLLRAKRAAGLLEPSEAHDLIDLMEQDARTAKLAGSGMRLDGVQNMTAEGEAAPPPHKAFVDLDNFKAVNDTIGHAAGDQVIGQTAEYLAHAFPDRVFHRGGDEFVIHGATPEELHAGLQRVRAALESAPMEFTAADGRSVRLNGVGMSYGVGEHVDAAEAGLHADKQARLDAGLRTERRAAGGDSGGNARRAGEVAENQDAPAARSVRPAASADEVAVAEKPAAREPPPAEQAPRQAEIGDMPPVASGDENPDNVTGIKHDKVAEERALKNQDEVTYEGKRTFGEAWDTAAQTLKDNPMHGQELARSILSKPRPLSAEESAALIQDRMRVKNAHEAAMLDAQHAMETGDELGEADARTRMRMAEDALEISDRAAKASGYEQGIGLAARRMLSRRDYTMASLAVRAKVARGEAITPAEHAQIEKLSKALAEADKQIAAMKAERASRRVGKPAGERKSADQHFRDLSAQLKAIREKDQLVPGCAA